MSMPEPTPLLRATVGAPVVDADGEKVGKVKEIRQGAFQVETGLFQSDFWLRGDVIAEAYPDQAVTLSITKSDINSYKTEEPQAA